MRQTVAQLLRQKAEITDSGRGPSDLASTNGNASAPQRSFANSDATQPALRRQSSAVTPIAWGAIGAAWAVPETIMKTQPATTITNAVRNMSSYHTNGKPAESLKERVRHLSYLVSKPILKLYNDRRDCDLRWLLLRGRLTDIAVLPRRISDAKLHATRVSDGHDVAVC